MSLPVSSPAATVETGLPEQGIIRVTMHRAKDLYIRPPAWTIRKQVRAFVGGKEVTPEWRSDYLYFAKPGKGDKITVSYPLVCFKQKQGLDALLSEKSNVSGKGMVIINSRGEKQKEQYGNSVVTYTWKGNTVFGVTPTGPCIPIYQSPKPPMPNRK